MILITGGMGFIGLHTARRFLDVGQGVVLGQYRSRREPEFLQDQVGKNLHMAQVDVRDKAALLSVLKQYEVTDIAHLVAPALNSVEPDDDFDISVQGVVNILQAARETGVKRVTLASSGAVYTGVTAGPFREDMPLTMETRSPTETFKKVWELLAFHYAARTGLDVVNMRIGSIWGPMFWHGGIFPVVRLCYAAARGGDVPEGLAIFGGAELFEDDESAPCFVNDCARGIQMLHDADKLEYRTYNVSVDQAISNRRIVEAIQKQVPGFDPPLTPGTSPRNRPDPYFDVSRLREDTGFKPEYDIERAVAEYIAWLRDHPEETMGGEGQHGEGQHG